MVDRDHFLQLFPHFRKAASALVGTILELSRHNRIPSNATARFEGDQCTDFVFVPSGEIRMYKTNNAGREITLCELGPGDICVLNASCILSRSALPAHAATTRDTDVLLLPAHDSLALMALVEEMRCFVRTRIHEGLTDVMTLIAEIVFSRMDDRLVNYLIEKSGHNHLARSHQQIAQDLGTSREVVSRLAKELERAGHHDARTVRRDRKASLVSAEDRLSDVVTRAR